MVGGRWRSVTEHPNYEINKQGQVRSKKTGRLLRPYDDGHGYLRVKLDRRNCRLHVLVAMEFVPNPNPEINTVVNHKKGIKYDCRASQLEWVTQSENVQHAWDHGLIKRKEVGYGK